MATANKYAKHVTRKVAQTEKYTPDQVKNNAGGYVALLGDMSALKRFLLIGAEGGTYYQGEKELIQQNVDLLNRVIGSHAAEALQLIQTFLLEGRAPKRNALLFSLAYIAKRSSDTAVKNTAYNIASSHINTPTDFFYFMECIKALGGFSTGVKKCIQRWYEGKSVNTLDYHVAKYAQREGWTHKDLFNIAHPPFDATKVERNQLIQYLVHKDGELTPGKEKTALPAFLTQDKPDEWNRNIWAKEKAKTASKKEVIKLIADYKLPMECVPKEMLAEAEVWAALVQSMPYTATLRNLGNLGKHKLLTPLSDIEKLVIERLTNVDNIKGAKVHPISILLASGTYGSGHSLKGSGAWEVNNRVTKALEAAFAASFKTVEPTGKRYAVGCDVSGSMSSPLNGYGSISCRDVSACFTKLLYDIEPNTIVGWFNNTYTLAKTAELASIENMLKVPWSGGGTNATAVVDYLQANKISVDCIVIITDCETWAGGNFQQAIEKYRASINPNAKFVCMGMTATNFTLAKEDDPLSMNIAGVDSSFPQLIAEFVR